MKVGKKAGEVDGISFHKVMAEFGSVVMESH